MTNSNQAKPMPVPTIIVCGAPTSPEPRKPHDFVPKTRRQQGRRCGPQVLDARSQHGSGEGVGRRRPRTCAERERTNDRRIDSARGLSAYRGIRPQGVRRRRSAESGGRSCRGDESGIRTNMHIPTAGVASSDPARENVGPSSSSRKSATAASGARGASGLDARVREDLARHRETDQSGRVHARAGRRAQIPGLQSHAQNHRHPASRNPAFKSGGSLSSIRERLAQASRACERLANDP